MTHVTPNTPDTTYRYGRPPADQAVDDVTMHVLSNIEDAKLKKINDDIQARWDIGEAAVAPKIQAARDILGELRNYIETDPDAPDVAGSYFDRLEDVIDYLSSLLDGRHDPDRGDYLA